MSTSPTIRRPFLLTTAIVAGPLAGALYFVTDQAGLPRTEAADYLAQVAADRSAYAISTLLYMVFVGCFIPTGLAVMRVLRDRAPLAATISGVLLALAGALGLIVSGMRPIVLALAPEGPVVAEAAAAYQRYQASPWFDFVMLPMLASVLIGLVVLAATILRTGALPRWTAALLVGGFVLSSGEFPPAVTILGGVMQLAGFVPLAGRLVTERRAEPALT
ncbi:DUF4386 family protein [Nonomuraea sp. SYSU D8015]|uniref:DUF4386 family protein n=1 Tax=Nonomuraea sp. SYSU D8015 TaxID=2593644 RepID=UPI001660EE53|nr:DUF4386 family protein [Nonomuraea sp. SYSU D8015]